MRELARRVSAELSEHQRRLAAACVLEVADASKITAGHLTGPRLERYLGQYFADPLGVTRRQNDFIRALPSSERKPFFKAAPMLNYLVEREAHVRPYSDPSSKTHEETTNQSYLFHGDLLPGTHFRLDDPSTVYREYLKIKKESDNTLPYTTGARMLAVHPDNYSQEQIARLLLEEVLNEKGGYKSDPEEGEVVGAGTVIRRGDDVCRHKAAMLVQCLQEAGIKAQYVRGYITGKTRFGISSGRHAWVHAELDGIPHRLDPQWGVFKTLEKSKKVRVPTEGNPSYSPESGTNVVWRRKRV